MSAIHSRNGVVQPIAGRAHHSLSGETRTSTAAPNPSQATALERLLMRSTVYDARAV